MREFAGSNHQNRRRNRQNGLCFVWVERRGDWGCGGIDFLNWVSEAKVWFEIPPELTTAIFT